jgi:hypothetical protein
MSGAGIVWLASYPKSGNTWLRTVLTNYLRDTGQPASIDELDVGPIASARAPLDTALGYECGELSHEEAERLRPELYRYLAEQAEKTLYCKVHDAHTYLPDGRPLFPPESTRAVLYVARNPLDVCVSFSHHNGQADPAATAREMADPGHCLCDSTRTQPLQLRQRLSSWSEHARSWLDAPLPVHVLRYEDMHADPAASFSAALSFAGLELEPERLRRAIEFSCFSELQRQERDHGFHERSPRAREFFRAGRVGTWREALQETVVAQLLTAHGPMMRRLGYLDGAGTPVF